MTDTPRDWADDKATADVTRWFHDNGFPCDGNDLPALERLYALALRAAARAQPGHVREGDTERKWTLPRTGDGVPVMPGMTLYYPSGVEASVLCVWFDGTLNLQSHNSDGIPENDWKHLRFNGEAYSTRAAAEAARTAGEGE